MEAINIHSNLAMVAKNVVVNIDIGNLTKNQLKRVVKQVENGYATSGHATSSYITRCILREYNLPHFIVGNESSSYMAWKNISSDHPFFDKLAGAVAITKLTVPEHKHQKDVWEKDIQRWERILLERPTTGNTDFYSIDYMVRDDIHSIGRVKLDEDHKVKELLEKLPDMTEFPIVIGRDEFIYPLPYEEKDNDKDEYYS